MSKYSELPIYNSVFFILKDLYIRVPKFSKQYKYLLGDKMLECCVNSILLINQISAERDSGKRIIYTKEMSNNINNLLTYTPLANELNQLGNKNGYFFLAEKIYDISNQIENWKKYLQKQPRN